MCNKTNLNDHLHHGHGSTIDNFLLSTRRSSSTSIKELGGFPHRERDELRTATTSAAAPRSEHLQSLQTRYRLVHLNNQKSYYTHLHCCRRAHAPGVEVTALIVLVCLFVGIYHMFLVNGLSMYARLDANYKRTCVL